MQTSLIITSPSDLQLLVKQAVVEALSQISLPQKIEPDSFPEYMSIEQTSQFLNLAVPTLYGLTSKRQIPFIKKAKKLYFIKSKLHFWLQEGNKKTRQKIEENERKNSRNQ